MELYHKKNNISVQRSKPQERYDNRRYNPNKNARNIYMQKVLKQKPSQGRNDPYEISSSK